MDKILFLDMDHNLIQPKSGNRFPIDSMDWEFIMPTKEKVLEFYDKGFKVVVVSNQGGIAYGNETHEGLQLKFESIQAAMGIPMTFFYSSTNDKSDPMRKPNTGMAEKAAEKYDIDWENSIMVGDASGLPGRFSDSDKKFAENAGIGTFYDTEEFHRI